MQGLVPLSIDVRSIYFHCCCLRREKVRSLQSPFICMISPSVPPLPPPPHHRVGATHCGSPTSALQGLQQGGKWKQAHSWRIFLAHAQRHTDTQAHRHMSSQVTWGEVGSLPPAGFFKGLGWRRPRLYLSWVLALLVQGQSTEWEATSHFPKVRLSRRHLEDSSLPKS